MILGIDASNIREGGGLTHLKEILLNANPEKHGFKKVVVWSSQKTLDKLPDFPWLLKVNNKWLNQSFIVSFLYQSLFISKDVRKRKCDLLFVPGGTFLGSFRHIISMSQNMLPFEKEELNRFPKWTSRLKFKLLKITQSYTFKKSEGIIFLTDYAKSYITNSIHLESRKTTVIPHGIKKTFVNEPKVQKEIQFYTENTPFRFLYVSIVTEYKHQWNVAKAILRLRNDGYFITLDLVGGYTDEALQKLNTVLAEDNKKIITYKGLIPYEELSTIYKNADGFIFASTCENMPIILIEAMTAGLPVASSEKQPMPEILKESAFYFKATDTDNIYECLKKYLQDPGKRKVNAEETFHKASRYTWEDCSDRTFTYLTKKIQENADTR